MEALGGKLKEFNQRVPVSLQISESQIEDLVESGINTETPARLRDIANLINILRWPTEFNFPCIDLVRLALVNPPASDLLLAKHAEELLDILLQNLSVTDKTANQMLALRCLANLFSSDKGNHMTVVETDTKKMRTFFGPQFLFIQSLAFFFFLSRLAAHAESAVYDPPPTQRFVSR